MDLEHPRGDGHVAGDGSCRSFEELYGTYRPQLLRLYQRLDGSTSDAEDAVQDVFTRLFRSRGDDVTRVGYAYLRRAVLNEVKNRHRNEVRRRTAEAEREREREKSGARHTWQPDRAFDRDRARAVLEDAVDQLPRREREAFARVHLEGLRYRDAAAALGTSVPNVRQRLYRARKRLRAYLASRGMESLEGL